MKATLSCTMHDYAIKRTKLTTELCNQLIVLKIDL